MSFNSLLRQTLTIANPSTTRDKTGKPSYSSGTTVRGRVQKTNKSIYGKDREIIPIHLIAFIGPAIEPQDEGKITYDSTAYRIKAFEAVVGRNGQVHHYEIQAQLWSYGS